MFTYNKASQYIEDNYYTKTDKDTDKYYCHKCNKITEHYTTSGFNRDAWSETDCGKCGIGHQGWENEKEYKDYLSKEKK